jgi:hypothetical protein
MHICVNMNLIFFHLLQDYEADTHSTISGVSGVSSENYPLLSKSPIQPILFGHEQGSILARSSSQPTSSSSQPTSFSNKPSSSTSSDHATSNIIANPVEALSSVNVLNKYAMLKCDTKEVSSAFQDHVENYLEKDCNWVNTGKTKDDKKKEGNSKSNFKKVIEYCMTLLSKEELAIRNTKQPKERPERSLWAGILLTLSNAVHKKLMSRLLTKEAEMREKHGIPQPSAASVKKRLVSTVGSLAKRISALKTMETIPAGQYKQGKKKVDIVS